MCSSASSLKSPFEFSVVRDGAIIIVSVGLLLGLRLSEFGANHPYCDPCDPTQINWLDRSVLGNQSSTARDLSDLLRFLIPMVALGFSIARSRKYGWRSVVEDALIIGECVVVTTALHQFVRSFVNRPRPFMYIPGLWVEERNTSNAVASFFSGHTALAFSIAVSFSVIMSQRRSRRRWIQPDVLSMLALASIMGVCRVWAGVHFWTDVLVAAAVAGSIGVVIPFVQIRRR